MNVQQKEWHTATKPLKNCTIFKWLQTTIPGGGGGDGQSGQLRVDSFAYSAAQLNLLLLLAQLLRLGTVPVVACISWDCRKGVCHKILRDVFGIFGHSNTLQLLCLGTVPV